MMIGLVSFSLLMKISVSKVGIRTEIVTFSKISTICLSRIPSLLSEFFTSFL
ncbi:hypothetical protein JHK87_029707 [Glycine soja]|nr:hypothetical protein JHK87_029707 [Glycine soja]KAG4993077.1 hypothetical protein JHK86_029904 [Glycine max]